MQWKRVRVSRVRENSGNDYFSDLILADLIKEGFAGEELLLKFREKQAEYRGAVRSLITESGQADRLRAAEGRLFSIPGSTVNIL